MTRLRNESRRRLSRLLDKHSHDCGLIVAGRFSLFRYSWTQYARAVAVIELDGRRAATISQLRRGPFWVPLTARRRHRIRVVGITPEPVEFEVTQAEREHRLLFVEPRRRTTAAVVTLEPVASDR